LRFKCTQDLFKSPPRAKQLGPAIQSLTSLDIEEVKRSVNSWNEKTPVDEASTPPKAYYTDPRFFSFEKEAIFGRNWIYAGRASLLEQKGSFITGEVMGEPYMITRTDDNELSAFYNVCRHHGTTLKEEPLGNCSEIVCPYHGWTYALDGKLLKTTQCKGIKNFSAKDNSLKKIKVKQMGPLVFIHFGNNDDESEEQFQEFLKADTLLSERSYEQLHWVRRVEYLVHCNWKIYVDNYIDGNYHVPVLHPGLDSQVDASQYDFFPNKNWSLQTVPGSNATDEFLKERVGSKGALYAFMYPTLGINRFGDLMDTNFLVPISIDKTLIVFDWYYVEKETEENKEKIDKLISFGHQTQIEDEIICERVQRGMYSQSWIKGRYAPTVEIGVNHFHSWYHSNYKEYLATLNSRV